MQKIRVGVLMGGKSCEREVSFNSGRTICDYIDTRSYNVIPIFQTTCNTLYILPWTFLHRGKIADFYDRLNSEATPVTWDTLKELVDLIYIAQHGRYAEDGTMQGMLEVLNIPYVGSKVLASSIGMDKIFQKKILAIAGINTPRDVIVSVHDSLDLATIEQKMLTQNITYPCIVKPHKEGSSQGISVVKNSTELIPALLKARSVTHKDQDVLIEEKINGMEFSCILIHDYATNGLKALTPTEVAVNPSIGFYDYEQKYMPGKQMHYTPPRCSKEDIQKIQTVSLETARTLGFQTIGRIDGFLTTDKQIIITDPNSFSGAAPSSFLFKQAALDGFTHTELINHLIKAELMHIQNKGNDANDSLMQEETNKIKKLRIGVIFGGETSEKEISLESGRNVVFKLSPHAYETIPLFLNTKKELYILNRQQLVSSSTIEIEKTLQETQRIQLSDLSNLIDFAFIALHGGCGENGSMQGLLELLEIPYNGSGVIASALCMDKYKTKQFLQSQGFDTPKGILIHGKAWESDKAPYINIIKDLGLPLIIKPHNDGCSTDVHKANSLEETNTILDTLFLNGRTELLIEEFIKGTELTGGVIGNEKAQALPPSQVVTTNAILSLEEKFLPGAGENKTPALLPPQAILLVQQTLENVYQSIGCKGYTRIDCFYQSASESPTQKERVIIIELNTLPALTPATCLFHQAAEIGIKPMDFIDLIVQLGMQEHTPNFLKFDAHENIIDTMPPTSEKFIA